MRSGQDNCYFSTTVANTIAVIWLWIAPTYVKFSVRKVRVTKLENPNEVKSGS